MDWDSRLEKTDDMDSITSESMEKFDDSFFDDFFENNTKQELEGTITEDDLSGLVFDEAPYENRDLKENISEENATDNPENTPYAYKYDPTHSLEIGNNYQDTSEGAKVLKLTKGDMSSTYKDIGTDDEGIKALNEFYSDIAGEIYENMKNIHEDTSLSPLEKVEKLSQESRKWEICKQEWRKDSNGKK